MYYTVGAVWSGNGTRLVRFGNGTRLVRFGNGTRLVRSGNGTRLVRSGNGTRLVAAENTRTTGACKVIRAGDEATLAISSLFAAQGRWLGEGQQSSSSASIN